MACCRIQIELVFMAQPRLIVSRKEQGINPHSLPLQSFSKGYGLRTQWVGITRRNEGRRKILAQLLLRGHEHEARCLPRQ